MRKYALLVGIEEYRDPEISALKFARADAEALAERLKAVCGFNETRVLVGTGGPDAPDLLNILNALKDMAGELRREDLFLLFFAGHGIERDGRGYLLTRESSYAFPEHTSLSLDLLRKSLERFPAARRIVVVDACRNCPDAARGDAGNVMGDAISRDIVTAVRLEGGGATTAFLSACSAGQRAYEWPSKGHGVFTHYLLEGIDGAAWRGDELEFDDLAEHAHTEVVRWRSATAGTCGEQTPWYEKFGAPARLTLARRQVATRPETRKAPPKVPPYIPPPIESSQEVGVLKGHKGRVWTVVFAPEGGRVLSAGRDREIRLWEATTGRQIRKFAGHTDTVNSVAVSPDGQWIASAGVDRTIRVWAIGSGRTTPTCLSGHKSNINSVAFSPDGRFLLSASGGELRGRTWVPGGDDNLRLWDVKKKQLVRCFDARAMFVWSVAYSPGGEYALSGGWDKAATLWDVRTGKKRCFFAGHEDEVRCVAFSPDGHLVASSSLDGTIQVWDIADSRVLAAGVARKRCLLKGHDGGVVSIAFSPDGKSILSGGEDSTARLWSLETGGDVHRFKGHTAGVCAVAFSPDGRLAVSAGDDATIRIWRVPGLEETPAKELVRRGRAFYRGEGRPRDPFRAARLFWPAAQAGDGDAQNALGWMYLNADGLPRDFPQAASLFAQAAEQGHAKGQFNLAWRYVTGEGVPKDEARARKWFEKAAGQGHKGAAEYLGRNVGTRVEDGKNKGTESGASAPGAARRVTGEAASVALTKIKALSRDFFTKDQSGRSAAARAVAKIAPAMDLASILLLCRSADPGERVAGFVAMTTYLRTEPPNEDKRPVLEILRLGLSDEESRVRYRALQSLEQSTAIARALERELGILADKDSNEPVRELATRLRAPGHRAGPESP